jgi:hypothetical protein
MRYLRSSSRKSTDPDPSASQFIVLDKKFNLNLVVLLMQSLIGVLLVVFAERMRWIQLRGLNRKDVTLWMPISTLLVFVIYTGSKAIVSIASLQCPRLGLSNV